MNAHLRQELFRGAEQADAEILAKTPALQSYLRRVGAVRRSFLHYEIEDHDAAPTYGKMRPILGHINIKGEEIVCDVDDKQPLPDELILIKLELATMRWPGHIAAERRNVDDLKRAISTDDSMICEFASAQGNEYSFVQQRIILDTGKIELPWTLWSDGHWRQMHPPGLLPLFNLPALSGGWQRIMVHEGAMAARKVQDMCYSDTPEARERLAAHPWGSWLRDFQHVGWAGGAEHPTRSDWSPFKKLGKNVEVVFVADNDQVGLTAIPKISRLIKRQMSVLRFDDNFDQGFDMANDWPKSPKWWRGNRFVVPPPEDYITPATWATDIVRPPPGSTGGRPTFKVRPDFAKEWVMVKDPQCYINRSRPTYLASQSAFDNDARPFSDVQETSKPFADCFASKVDGVIYSPAERTGVVTIDGRRVFNTYMPGTVKAATGRVRHFEFFMRHLIPDERERRELMRWCATLIAHPGTRMHYGVLLISERQGVGKGTLGEKILAPILGRHNCSFPSEQDMTDSKYNSWIVHRRLAVVHEMYTGHSRKAYDKLKSLVTDDSTRAHRKYVEEYDIDIWLHILACSNSKQALHLDDEDRRWFVPTVTEKELRLRYWRAFNAWLVEGGLGVIKQWANDFFRETGKNGKLINHPIRTGDRPPQSSGKDEVISLSRSEGMRLAFDFVEHVKEYERLHPEQGPLMFRADEVRAWIAAQRQIDINDRRMEKLLTIRKALRTAGMFEPERLPGRPDNRVKVDGRRWAYIVATRPLGALTTLREGAGLDMTLKKPEDIAF